MSNTNQNPHGDRKECAYAVPPSCTAQWTQQDWDGQCQNPAHFSPAGDATSEGEWRYESGGIHSDKGRIILADRENSSTRPVERDNMLKQIVREHNAHRKLVEALRESRAIVSEHSTRTLAVIDAALAEVQQ